MKRLKGKNPIRIIEQTRFHMPTSLKQFVQGSYPISTNKQN
jgi:hypothetical protein